VPDNFAPPLSKLSQSGIGVAAAPSGGMGLALDPKGFVPRSVLAEAPRSIGDPGQPAFENGWVNFGAGAIPASFYLTADGHVHIQGLVATGTVATNVFTLPVGYRPGATFNLITMTNPGAVAAARIQIKTDGSVVAAEGNNAGLSIDVIFRAA
jgi:hypothetical protein